MRFRTHSEMNASKAIYRKHADRYKSAGYPVHRAKRMLLYTSLITKATLVAMKRD